VTSELPAAVPEIPVRSIDEAMAYYQASLGFTLDWHEEKLGLAGISRGNCRIFLASEEFRNGYRNVGPTLTWLNLDSKEAVDELHRQWTSRDARIISPLDARPRGCGPAVVASYLPVTNS
jgi:hypothetical protein